jgi:ATP-dependent helicase HrpA
LANFLIDARQSESQARQRQARLPKITYPEELPISAKRGEIASAIQSHQVVIVCGETGSGKTTQLPKICLDLAAAFRG